MIRLWKAAEMTNMKICRVIVDKNSIDAARLISDQNSGHKIVERICGYKISDSNKDGNIAERPRRLWRIEQNPGNYILYIVSETIQNRKYAEDYLTLSPSSVEVLDYDEFLNSIVEGKRYMFKLKAAPSKQNYDPQRQRRHIRGLYRLEDQMEWLHMKGNAHGFVFNDSDINCYSTLNPRRLPQKEDKQEKYDSKHPMIQTVTYTGILTVDNRAKFKSALITGIGRSKAYGYGLLTVYPLD